MRLDDLERQARRLELPARQKAVLLCLIFHANWKDGSHIFPGIKVIAAETGYCERTVQYSLRELEIAGWVTADDLRGGFRKPSQYHLNFDQFENMVARPIERPAPPERTPAQRLNYARGMLKRLKLDSPARAKWEKELEDAIDLLNFPQEAPQQEAPQQPPAPLRDLPAKISRPELVPFQIAADLAEMCKMYLGLINLQACEEKNSQKWWDYQRILSQARASYNLALDQAGIFAPDGHRPFIDDELEQQMQSWARIVAVRYSARDHFTVGSEKWEKWNRSGNEAQTTFYSLFPAPQPVFS